MDLIDSDSTILCSGCFNGFHPQHLALFKEAAQYGRVIAGINGDRYNELKNGVRAIPAVDRSEMLLGVRYISEVIVFEEDTPSELIMKLKPRFFMKGPDYRAKTLPEQAACDLVGTQVVFRTGEYLYSSRILFS